MGVGGVCDQKICSPDTLVNKLASRTMNIPPSGDGCNSLTGVRGGVLGGGGCEKLNFRRVGEGGGVSCSNSCHD